MRPLSNWDERAASPILTHMASPIPTRMALHSAMPAYKLRPCLTLSAVHCEKWNTKKGHKGRKGIERGWETEKYSLNLPDPGAGEPNRDLPGTSITLVRKHTEVKMPSSWVGKAGAFVKIPVSVQC